MTSINWMCRALFIALLCTRAQSTVLLISIHMFRSRCANMQEFRCLDERRERERERDACTCSFVHLVCFHCTWNDSNLSIDHEPIFSVRPTFKYSHNFFAFINYPTVWMGFASVALIHYYSFYDDGPQTKIQFQRHNKVYAIRSHGRLHHFAFGIQLERDR